MRIILLLATAAMAAAGGAAPAQPGRSGIAVGTMRPAVRAPGFHRARPFHPGPGRGRPHRPRRGSPDAFPFPWGAGGFDGVEAVDPHGNGFFAGAGGGIRIEGGRPRYDYDRAYPYEWASAAGGGALEWRVEAMRGPLPERCTVERGVQVCRGGR